MTHQSPLTLNDEQFATLRQKHPHLTSSDRKPIALILEVLRTGVSWQNAPEEEYGIGWRVTYERFCRWRDQNTLEGLLKNCLEILSISDLTHWSSAFERSSGPRVSKRTVQQDQSRRRIAAPNFDLV